jgi:23S rRNA (adenine2503-C2)-methyltransferase
MKIKLLGKNLDELKKLVAEEGLPGFTAKQIAQWIYVKKVRTIDEMTNLSKAARAALAQKYEVGVTPYAGLQISTDGTKKYLFPVKCSHKRGLNLRVAEDELEDGAIEAVMIPDDERATLCVSSQSGCRMGCRFCMTGRQGSRL